MAEKSLKDKTISGVGWTAAETVLRYGVSFIVGIILARLLSPDEYGLIGILTIFITIFEIIIDGGFINALIRKQDAQDIDYYTVFWTNLLLSIMMAGILYAGSGFIAKFFERDELIPLMHVMSSIVIINALSLVQKARLTKALDFKTQTKVSVIAAVCSGFIGIWMAYAGYGVWALVAQQLSNAGIATLLFWLFNRWLPKLHFSIESFQNMWNFGWKLLISGLLNNLSGQLSHAVIGKCFSPATLGQFTRGHQFGTLFSSNTTSIVQRVTFPVLSEIQDDPVRLKDAYRRVIRITVFPTFVMMMTLAACAKPLLVVLIGEKWIEAAYFLQIMSFSLMLNPLHALNLNAIQVMGRSDLTLRINIIKNLLVIIPIAIGILTNIYWMLVADVIRGYICYYLNAHYSKPLLNYSIGEQIIDIFPSFKYALLMAIPTFLLSFLPFIAWVVLIIQTIFVFFVGIAFYMKSQLYEIKAIKEILFEYKQKIKK